MKKIITATATLLSSLWLPAQDNSVVTPSAYATTLNNYVRSWEAVKPDATEANFTLSAGLQHSRIQTLYLDGLGRPVQTVIKGGALYTGATATDFVQPEVYDHLGRQVRWYLPFAAGTSDGSFKTNPFQQQQSFYADANTNSPIKGQGETYYYGKTELEASPMNRPLRSYAPGNNWVSGTGRGTTQQYLINTAGDSVRYWQVDAAGNCTSATAYPAGELEKLIDTDEHGKQVINFTDRAGHIVLKKVQLTAATDDGTGKGHTGWLCTYYIYDADDLLRNVIQPGGVELLQANNWVFSSSIYWEQTFRYTYDAKRRMIEKKTPGAMETRIVYDALNRVVLTQDGKQWQGGGCVAIRYDALNRPIQTWSWPNSGTIDDHRAAAAASTDYPGTGVLTDLLTETYYDNYSWAGNPFGNMRNTAWDTYLEAASNTTYPYPQAVTQSSMTKGLVTGTKTRIMTTGNFHYSILFYDEKGRVIQTQKTNYSGGTDVTITQYAWAGVPRLVIQKVDKVGINAQITVVVTRSTYDDLLRLTKTEKRVSHSHINSGAISAYITLSELAYNSAGQLREKKLGRTTNGSGGYTTIPVETLTYDFNIRGWLLGINKGYLSSASQSSNYFGMQLDYDKDGYAVNSTRQYNGNIAAATWRSRGDGERRRYGYSYDAGNRLLKGDFTQYYSGTWSNATVNFTVRMGDGSYPLSAYDANGNIKKMQQWGLKGSSSLQIDNLNYTYVAGSNRLINVLDSSNTPHTALGDFRTSQTYLSSLGGTKTSAASDYYYDVNGNLEQDLNRDIPEQGIVYNYLNLPESIQVTGKGYVRYVYDATGARLAKVVAETSKPVVVNLYLGDNVYENNVLQTISHEEGRITYTAAVPSHAATLSYDYFVKDHLGNVRMVLSEGERVDAYPAASMETTPAPTEEALYANLTTTRTNKPAGYPADTYTSPNDKVAKVNGSGTKIGPAIALRVMAGDAFLYRVSSYWANSAIGAAANPLTDLVTAMSSGIGALSDKAGITELAGSTAFSNQINNFLSSRNNNGASPKAYIQWVLFDEQFNYVTTNSGAQQVGSADVLSIHQTTSAIPITKNGYLYIYVSNETQSKDVYFDNLQVTHVHGAILEETHYYPFGVTMAGISSSSLNFGKLNRLKYNGKELQSKEFSNGSGLDWYDYGARMYNQQIGRWNGIDPKGNKYYSFSLYNYVLNNPLSFIDPDGKEIKLVGTDEELKRLNKALAIVAKTNPEIYKALEESKEVFSIRVGELIKKRIDLSTGNKNTIQMDQTEGRTDLYGELTEGDLTPKGALRQEKDGSFTRGRKTGDEPARVNITEQEANELVKMNDAKITIDQSLSDRDFGRVLAHEFGHGAYRLSNKARSAFYQADNSKMGHDKGNPDGEAANAAGNRYDENYRSAKKQIEEERDKEKSKLSY